MRLNPELCTSLERLGRTSAGDWSWSRPGVTTSCDERVLVLQAQIYGRLKVTSGARVASSRKFSYPAQTNTFFDVGTGDSFTFLDLENDLTAKPFGVPRGGGDFEARGSQGSLAGRVGGL